MKKNYILMGIVLLGVILFLFHAEVSLARRGCFLQRGDRAF